MHDDATTSAAPAGAAGAGPARPAALPLPARVGRYRVIRQLGEGGFGRVYLAEDEQLQRRVAVKVPHPRRVSGPDEATAYLAEARAAALLDHPNVVPVYDVGSTDDCPCFIVSKYIEGCSLSDRIRDDRPSPGEAAELVATMAEALHYAHRKGLVHRDVKPANVLIDRAGNPFLTDFGLALRERTGGAGYGGTPPYMAPEQARGEGHRIDGRSDIFSLGVVFYELLTGRRPFDGENVPEILEQVASLDPRPPRQHDDNIPRELERICLKALTKRASDRYSTARDMAEDLRHWLAGPGVVGAAARVAPVAAGPPEAPGAAPPGKAVFLSHATPDAPAAQELCRLLEEQGVGCWIAPRDVPPGADYGEAIIRGIESAGTTVLLLSSHANASIHVRNEVERATSKRRRVVPVRLEDVLPNKSMELHLSTAQWLDAWKIGMAQVASELARVVREPLGDAAAPPSAPAPPAPHPAPFSSSDSRPLRIVPKGLRSFDAHDADFFLELLPGARDRDGLPDSIRLWKTRIEEPDADATFAVGLIYGPSGCGKSSLVKAGLLPRLAERITAVYVEATAEETEARLLNGLRKRCPALPAALGLKESLAALRRGQGVPAGGKVLIVLDQFEQWLHAKKEQADTELVQALRQCDGARLQCLALVRDDFWLAVSRFLRELEIRLVEGHNSALVDLFDPDHARKVLAAFGRAFGRLPEKPSEDTESQRQFLRRAIAGLSQDGKVISVRLALFAEMTKGRPWTPAALREVGGAEGVGVTFLEETFSAAGAPPEHRFHQKAARAVLKALLPESGTDIKGHMRSHAELLEASGYSGKPREFDDLVRILDGETRLVTPTDPEGRAGEDGEDDPTAPRAAPDQRYYQLTHDYLVPSMRQWLTRKQKETRRGRAELALADRAGVWNARPENRQLPSLWQWLSIRLLTRAADWTPPQRKMMGRAARYHSVRGAALAVVLAAAAVAGLSIRGAVVEQQKEGEAARLADLLVLADPTQFTANYPRFQELDGRGLPALYRELDQKLRADAADNLWENLAKRQANAAVALLRMGHPERVWPLLRHDFDPEGRPYDPRLRSYVIDRLGPLGADPKAIMKHVAEQANASVRSALVLSLGGFAEQAVAPADRAVLVKQLQTLYSDDPDPCLHAAAESVLRAWKQDAWLNEAVRKLAADAARRTQPAGAAPRRQTRWYVNGQGQTMVVVSGPVTFTMGSPPTQAGHSEEERQHRARIGRTFAIAAKAVTVSEYKRSGLPGGRQGDQDSDLPVRYVSWHDAAAYCNWLSGKEGISKEQWCYEIQGEAVKRMKEGYLGLSGYRLPTEAEMEYVTRAGASTARNYGETEELLPKYAWHDANSANQPRLVGLKRPNDLGLFDTLGNVWCWCQDRYQPYPEAGNGQSVEDKEDDSPVTEDASRVLRGGSFYFPASSVRCAYRFNCRPAFRVNSFGFGFRPARTLRPDSLTRLPPPAEGG